VEINPQAIILPDNPNSSNHNIRVEVDWDAQEEQANGHFWNANLQVNTQLTDNCDQIVGATGFVYGWPTGSSILNIQNANAYYYTLRVTLTGFYGAYQSVDVNYRFYFDDELIQSDLIEAMSGLDYTWTVTRYYERTHYVFLVDFLDFRINTYNYPVEYKSNYNLLINPGNSCSSTNVVSLTDEVNLSIIQGSQYLAFYQIQTEDTLGSSTQTILSDLNNILLIYNQPLRDTLDTLGVIKIEGNGLVEYDSVTIKPALFDLIVETDPKIIAPGDTAIVTVKRRTDYGTEEFNSDQSFDVWIVEGSNYGLLLDSLTGNSGSSLTGAVNRFRIVANDSIDVDSTKISIKVTTEESVISARLTRDNTKTNITERAQTENNDDETILPDWFVPPGETTLLEGFGDVVLENKYEIEILNPIHNSEEWITKEPKMPDVICKAKLKNYDKGNITFEWEYWTSYILFRHAYSTADTLMRRTGKVEIQGKSYTNNSEVTTWTVPFKKDSLKYVLFTVKQPEIPDWSKYGGDNNEKRTVWNEGDDIFIGGDVFVQVTAKNTQGKIIGFKQQNSGTILGECPTLDEVLNHITSKEFKAIVKHESKSKQFNTQDTDQYYKTFKGWLEGWKYNKKGYPRYGPPNGYGLAQVDNPPPLEMDLWNWKSNLNRGKSIYDDAKTNAFSFMEKHSNTYTEEMLIKCAFQKYNMGGYEESTGITHYFWRWDDYKGQWVDDEYIIERTKKNGFKERYGITIWNIYKSL
jgi:hypothetical protein